MTRIDVVAYRELAQAAGLGDLVTIYYERVESVGGWRCRSCAVTFADRIPFGPPEAHECAAYLCANCEVEAGIRTKGSHGICPRHFVLSSLPPVASCFCSRCDIPTPPGTVVYAAGPFVLCHDCNCASKQAFVPKVTA